MSYEPDIHKEQMAILRELLFKPAASFSDLLKKTELTSDHFNFHIKKLVSEGYIAKTGDGYTLSTKGKEYANRLDTDKNVIEKQPKISVLLLIERTRDDGRTEYLLQQRLKQPFYGFWGRFGGKVGFGESFEDTAARELEEETGLKADFEFYSIYRKRDYSAGEHKLLEDKVFVQMRTDKVAGELVEDFEGGHNEWLTIEQIKKLDKIFGGAEEFIKILLSKEPYITTEHIYSDDEY